MKKVIVLGASGQLATCIKDVLKLSNTIKADFLYVNQLDITNSTSVSDFFNLNAYDVFINCAAYTAVDTAENDKAKAAKVNIEGVRNLAIACKKQESTFIHISTDFVFDGKKSSPYLETDSPNPINVYGQTKLYGEKVLQDITSKYYIFRTSWLYSEYGHNFFKTMLRLGKDKNELSIVNDQIGTPTYAKDLALVIIKAIEYNTLEYGIYNYSNSGEASWYDFASAIFKEVDLKIKLNSVSTEQYITLAKRPAYSVLDKSKIEKKLHIEIPHWKNSLKTCIKNYHLKNE